ncbi:hypothetical protein BC826DRAFT_980252 [Russula brevipes]|nr:hypothetical protein BC826DRAFT_980252 [Russula brevipes]
MLLGYETDGVSCVADAGMAILLGERAHLIEFPSLLLPPGATTGSIVNISVTQNVAEEHKRDREFWELQSQILEEFGRGTPKAPQIGLRNVTQTSVTLEWPTLELATASLRSLDIYKNDKHRLFISSGHAHERRDFQSNLIRVRTHTMTDTSGISDSVLLENAKLALQEMRAKWSDKIQIDTTHFVCTTPAATPTGAQTSGSISSAPGVEYQRALQLSIPIVQPQWILSCYAEKKMVPISAFYLGTTQSTPMNSPPFARPQSMSQASLPQSAQATKAANRASMPAPSRTPTSSGPTPPVNSGPPSKAALRTVEPTPEEGGDGAESPDAASPTKSPRNKGPPRARHGTMDRAFKFPPTLPAGSGSGDISRISDEVEEAGLTAVDVIAPSSPSEVPPPPIEKERPPTSHDDGDEDVGETEEISLN